MAKSDYTTEEWLKLTRREQMAAQGRVKNGRKGVGSMSPERRREIALMGAAARWSKKNEHQLNQQPSQDA